MAPAGEEGGSGVLRRLVHAVGILLSLAGLAFVVRALVGQWGEAREALRGIEPVWFAAGIASTSTGMLVVALLWRTAMRLVGTDLPTSRVLSLYFRGEIAKYIPGGVWATLGRSELARREGMSGSHSYGSTLLSLGAVALAGAIVSAALLPLVAGPGDPQTLWALGIIPVGLVGLHPRIFAFAVRVAERLLRGSIDLSLPSWRRGVAFVGPYVVVWGFLGLGSWCVARALMPDPPLAEIVFANALASVAGLVAVPVPAGLGFQEATFVVLATSLPDGVAAAVAIGSRVLTMLVDAAGAVAATAADAGRAVPEIVGSSAGDHPDGDARVEGEARPAE